MSRKLARSAVVVGVVALSTASPPGADANSYKITAGGHAMASPTSPLDMLMTMTKCSPEARNSALNGIGERIIPASTYAGRTLLVRATAVVSVPMINPPIARFTSYTAACGFGVPSASVVSSDTWRVQVPAGVAWMNVVANPAVDITFTITIVG